jgi:uncharacterized membrane protein YgaE (UPF0421/DUF939 family)
MGALRQRLRDPVLWTDTSQLLKTAGAAVLAWVLAKSVLGIAQPFLAPWAALLTVHATVYRTFARGAQQVGATLLGVLLAFGAGHLLGVNAWSLALTLVVALLVGLPRGLRGESTTAAVTALVVLLTGYSTNHDILASRLLDTLVGIGVGLIVNLVVWPPLRDRSAAQQVDRIDDAIGALLTEIAAALERGEPDVESWVQRTRDIDHDIDSAWSNVRQARESGRLNPRRHARRRVGASDDLERLLARLEQAVAETRSMVRTVGLAQGTEDWTPAFAAAWTPLLRRAGEAVTGADPDRLEQVRAELDGAGHGLSTDDTLERLRPAHGALVVNLRNIVDAMQTVAGAQPVRPRTRRAAAVA